MSFGITVGSARRTRSFVGENGSAVAGAEDHRDDIDEDREPRPRDSSPLGLGRPRSNRENMRFGA